MRRPFVVVRRELGVIGIIGIWTSLCFDRMLIDPAHASEPCKVPPICLVGNAVSVDYCWFMWKNFGQVNWKTVLRHSMVNDSTSLSDRLVVQDWPSVLMHIHKEMCVCSRHVDLGKDWCRNDLSHRKNISKGEWHVRGEREQIWRRHVLEAWGRADRRQYSRRVRKTATPT